MTAKVITATLGTRCPRVLVARCLRRSEKIRPTKAETAAAPDPARDFGFWKFKPPARAGQVSSLLALIELISPSNKPYESWWAPETRTEVRAILIDPRQGKIVSVLMDYQRIADPAGMF